MSIIYPVCFTFSQIIAVRGGTVKGIGPVSGVRAGLFLTLTPDTGPKALHLLELLERLPASRAVVDGSAERRAEGVFHHGFARPAVRTFGHGHELDQIAPAGHFAGGRGREA